MKKQTSKTGSRTARWAGAAGLLAAGAISGSVLAGALSANATTSATTTPSSSSASQPARTSYPDHGTAAHEALEKAVTGANATKAQAAALKAVGSGKAGAVTTDVSGDGYEVTVTKSDGSTVEVHLDQSFAISGQGGFGG